MPLPSPEKVTSRPVTEATHQPVTRPKYKPSDVFIFEPRSDITTEELAQIIAITYQFTWSHTLFQKQTSAIQRHFRQSKTTGMSPEQLKSLPNL